MIIYLLQGTRPARFYESSSTYRFSSAWNNSRSSASVAINSSYKSWSNISLIASSNKAINFSGLTASNSTCPNPSQFAVRLSVSFAGAGGNNPLPPFQSFLCSLFLNFSDYLNALFKAELIAFLFVSSLGCTYTSNVVLTSLCPNIEETVFTSILLSISVEANVWRSP